MKTNRFWTTVQIALDVFGERRLLQSRNLLVITGIAIGTAAVISMIHLGHNARLHSLNEFQTMGPDLFVVALQQTGSHPSNLSIDAVNQLPTEGLGVEVAAATISTSNLLRSGTTAFEAQGVAAGEAIYTIGGATLQRGRFTSNLDGHLPHAVLGANIAQAIELQRLAPIAIGEKLTYGDQVLSVVGILAPTPANPLLTLNFDSSIFLPLEASRRVAPNSEPSFLVGRFVASMGEERMQGAIESYLQSHMQAGQAHLRTAQQLIEGVEAQMRIYAMLLFGIGGISLVVSGVGIMNVMLMRVLEKRQEIGIRQALGARRSDIRLMFLSETIGLSLIGGAVGLAFGHVSGWLFAERAGWSFESSSLALPLGIGMAAVVGLFFGLYPAERAARLDPVVALRGEG